MRCCPLCTQSSLSHSRRGRPVPFRLDFLHLRLGQPLPHSPTVNSASSDVVQKNVSRELKVSSRFPYVVDLHSYLHFPQHIMYYQRHQAHWCNHRVEAKDSSYDARGSANRNSTATQHHHRLKPVMLAPR